jgi:hypothetical protein
MEGAMEKQPALPLQKSVLQHIPLNSGHAAEKAARQFRAKKQT